MPTRIVICWSGGKDSAMALDALSASPEYDVVGLLTTVTAEYDRVSMHGVRRSLLRRQAAALRLPLEEVSIPPAASNETYEAEMGAAFDRLRERGIAHVAFGDLFLEDIRAYRERLAARHEMQPVFPVWGRDTRAFAAAFFERGFRATVVCVDPQALAESFAGREFDRDFVADLPAGVDPCGENGEFHTFVWDGPGFSQPLPVVRGETVRRGSFVFCDLVWNDQAPIHEVIR